MFDHLMREKRTQDVRASIASRTSKKDGMNRIRRSWPVSMQNSLKSGGACLLVDGVVVGAPSSGEKS